MVHLCGPCACVWLDFWTFFLRFVCVQLQLLLPPVYHPRRLPMLHGFTFQDVVQECTDWIVKYFHVVIHTR